MFLQVTLTLTFPPCYRRMTPLCGIRSNLVFSWGFSLHIHFCAAYSAAIDHMKQGFTTILYASLVCITCVHHLCVSILLLQYHISVQENTGIMLTATQSILMYSLVCRIMLCWGKLFSLLTVVCQKQEVSAYVPLGGM